MKFWFGDSLNGISLFPPQIKEKLLQLTDKRKDMIDKWEDRWEWLRLGKMFHPETGQPVSLNLKRVLFVSSVLEVHQFSRDAGVAEAWLLGQEPYLSSREMGQSVDEVEKLIKRHEAFEKSAATWEERFAALERLTTVSHGCPTPCTHPGWMESEKWLVSRWSYWK